jgi:AP endonuclease-1
MAAGDNVLGSTFEDLRDTIALVHNKGRVGVCLDTCHAFAAGYDLRSPKAFKATMDDFEKIVGFKYLRALHMNDSKAPLASHRDLHANIGTGFLGLRAFHNIINEPRVEGLPMILETPLEAKDEVGTPVKDDKGKPIEDKGIWAREIKLLESLHGADTESEDFLKLEKELARKGESERKKHAEQMEKKREKAEKKAKGSKKKGGKKGKKLEESEEEEMSFSELEEEATAAGDTQRFAE